MSDTQQHPSKCFRPPLHWLVVGIVCTIFFPTMGITSVYAAYWNIDGSFPHPKLHALAYGVIWSLATITALPLIPAYFRVRLTITSDELIQQGCFIHRRMKIGDVTEIRWKGIPQSGRLILHAKDSRMVIDLTNIASKDCTEFIQLARQLFDGIPQTGWSEFNRLSTFGQRSADVE